LVYDVTSRESFTKMETWRQNFITKSGCKDPETFPFVLLGNKADLVSEDPKNRQVTQSEVTEFCESAGVLAHLETSAKEDQNVE
jgi:Ras-related protein Rab-7A